MTSKPARKHSWPGWPRCGSDLVGVITVQARRDAGVTPDPAPPAGVAPWATQVTVSPPRPVPTPRAAQRRSVAAPGRVRLREVGLTARPTAMRVPRQAGPTGGSPVDARRAVMPADPKDLGAVESVGPPPLPLGRGRLVFDSFTGGDVKRWLEHQMVEVHAQLTAHAASQIASLSQAGAIPMKQRDKSQRVHLERAARWHVGDEAPRSEAPRSSASPR